MPLLVPTGTLCLLLLLAVIGRGRATLTPAELAQFRTSGITERNTGQVGTVSVTVTNGNYLLTSNGIPDHQTGTFPATSNPNSIAAQTFSFPIPINPVVTQKKCLPMGPIAFAKNGIPMFNPFTIQGNNAVEGPHREIFDSCDGHPDQRGVYHYHQHPDCVGNSTRNEFLGVALDGHPIYGPLDENGAAITTASLDECHGRFVGGRYRYHTTRDYPYIMGCFKGDTLARSPPGQCYTAIATTVSPANPTGGSTGGADGVHAVTIIGVLVQAMSLLLTRVLII